MPPQQPDVSVIIGAYNAMPYLTRCLDSAVGQSIGPGRMEVIAVDDGSTDGTGAELDRFAAAYGPLVRVVHQPNSGGPAAPRNAGLELARGRFVFFLDADDYLGPEALERLSAAADTHGSDVVLGRAVGVGGRHAPRSMFRRSVGRTSVFDSRVYWSLNPMKLFRRELIERTGLRFRTDLTIGEDQPFTAAAYLRAAAVSVVADYDCHYWVARDDGANITQLVRGTEHRVRTLEAMFALIAAETEPGAGRDLLLQRHFGVDVRKALARLAGEPERAEQERVLERLRQVLDPWYGAGVAARLSAADRLRCALVLRGRLDEVLELLRYEDGADGSGAPGGPLALVEEGRVYARHPYFRDPARALPDELFDITREVKATHRLDSFAGAADGTYRITGHASLPRLGGGPVEATLILAERGGTAEHRLPVTPLDGDEPGTAFEVTVAPARAADGAPLPEGLWDLHLEVSAQGVTRRARFGGRRADDGPALPDAPVTQLVRTSAAPARVRAVTGYFTRPYGNLTLDTGERYHPVPSRLHVDTVHWAPGVPRRPALLVTGHCALVGLPPGALTLRAESSTGAQHTDTPATLTDDAHFTARLPLTGLTTGDWHLSLRLTLADRVWTLPLPTQPELPPLRWLPHALPHHAKPLPSTSPLTLHLTRTPLLRALRHRVRRLVTAR